MKPMLEDHSSCLTASQLTSILAAAASYAMVKVEYGKKKDDGKEPSNENLFRMFKDQVTKTHANPPKPDPFQSN